MEKRAHIILWPSEWREVDAHRRGHCSCGWIGCWHRAQYFVDAEVMAHLCAAPAEVR